MADHFSRFFSSHHEWSLRNITRSIFPEVGVSPCRPQNRKCQQFCSLRSCSPGSLNRCLPFPIGKAPVVHKRNGRGKRVQGPTESQVRQSKGYSYSPCMAASTLIRPVIGPISSDPVSTPSRPGPDLARSRLIAPPESQGPPPDCVEMPWLNLTELAYSEQVCQVLLGS